MSDSLRTAAREAIPVRARSSGTLPKTIDHLQKHSIETTRRWEP
jgi:hypothetical protein